LRKAAASDYRGNRSGIGKSIFFSPEGVVMGMLPERSITGDTPVLSRILPEIKFDRSARGLYLPSM
jgi:hypothetical protein